MSLWLSLFLLMYNHCDTPEDIRFLFKQLQHRGDITDSGSSHTPLSLNIPSLRWPRQSTAGVTGLFLSVLLAVPPATRNTAVTVISNKPTHSTDEVGIMKTFACSMNSHLLFFFCHLRKIFSFINMNECYWVYWVSLNIYENQTK